MPQAAKTNYKPNEIYSITMNLRKSIGENAPDIKEINEIIENKKLIHYWLDDVITLFDPIENKKKEIKLARTIASGSNSISVGNKIFIVGGFPATIEKNEMYELNLISNKLIQKTPMLKPKYHNTLCSANKYIYSVGGYDGLTSINNCEKYLISYDIWMPLPALKTERYGCAAFTFNDAYIYSLCGVNHSGMHINSVEKLILNCGKWEYVEILNMFSPRSSLYGIQISGNEAIVYGGFYGIWKRECYVLCMEGAAECKRICDLTEDSVFVSCAAPVFDGLYVFNSDNKKVIHIYSIVDKMWTAVK